VQNITQKYPLIILFGPPGCGKGTQANLLSKKLNLYNFSLGSSVRKFVNDNSEPSSQYFKEANVIKDFLQSGELIDFEIVKKILKSDFIHRIEQGQDVLLEGLPRTVAQADWLVKFIETQKIEAFFYHFILSEQLVLDRLSSRYYVSGDEQPYSSYEEALEHCKAGEKPVRRKDDMSLDIVRHRYEVQYASCEAEIIAKIQNCRHVNLIDIDASPTQDKIFQNILDSLKDSRDNKTQSISHTS
jgi:adenylate kinase